MSLESKLANLSLGDEASVVEAIKADGVEKSGFASGISALCAAIEGSDDAASTAALATVAAVAAGAPEAEAFTKETLAACKYFGEQKHEKKNRIIYENRAHYLTKIYFLSIEKY